MNHRETRVSLERFAHCFQGQGHSEVFWILIMTSCCSYWMTDPCTAKLHLMAHLHFLLGERLDCSGHGHSNSSKVHWMFDNPIFSVPLHTDLFETKLCQCIDALLVTNRPSECIDSSTVTQTITRHLTGMFRHARGHISFCEECAFTCNLDASLKYVSVLTKSWPACIMFSFCIM